MIRGLYTAGTNMLFSTRKIDILSNNMANANTIGYKRDSGVTEAFNDVLIHKLNGSDYTMTDQNDGIRANEIDEKSYIAETRKGYFRVETEDGISHNRNVKFSVDPDGYLSTYYKNSDQTKNFRNANKVLDSNGDKIFVGENNFEIDDKGQVLVDGESVGTLVKNVPRSVIGTTDAGVKRVRTFTDFEQGSFKITERNLDIALNGSGFIELKNGDETLYTRNGRFKLNASGELINMNGDFVEGRNGKITLNSTDVQINEFGEIIENNEIIDKITIKSFTNVDDLEKVGGSYYVLREDMVGEEKKFEGQVTQGFLEESNVSSVKEMIRLTQVNRNYETSQKLISSMDSTLDKIINSAGRMT